MSNGQRWFVFCWNMWWVAVGNGNNEGERILNIGPVARNAVCCHQWSRVHMPIMLLLVSEAFNSLVHVQCSRRTCRTWVSCRSSARFYQKEPGRRAINLLDCNRSHVTQSNKPHDPTTRRYYVQGRLFSRFDIRRFFALIFWSKVRWCSIVCTICHSSSTSY